MIQPNPYKFVCLKCGYSKTIVPKSDAIDPKDIINYCFKCNCVMEKKELNAWDKLTTNFLK